MLVTHCDNNYIDWAEMFLLSVKKFAFGEFVFISAMYLKEEQIKRLQGIYSNVIISNHFDVIPKTIKYRQYMQCRISKVLLEAYEANLDRYIIGVNIDILVRKSMDDLYNLMSRYDIGIHFTDEHMRRDPPQIQNGIIVIDSHSTQAKEFLIDYDSMWANNKIAYYDDQKQLYITYQKFKQGLRFFDIPVEYMDGDLTNISYIWSAHKGDRFLNYKKFQKELDLQVSKECPNPQWRGDYAKRI